MSGVLLRDELKVPLVLEFNGSEVWAQRHWGEPLKLEALGNAVERVSLRHADLVVMVSQPLVEQAVALGAARERVLFYPNGIDPQVFDPARFTAQDARARARGARRSRPTPALLTFVGTFGTWHGTDVLATAIRRLIDAERAWLERQRVHFLYVGDGALAPKVRAILGDGTGAPFVTLAGTRPQAETPRTLAASDILLSPHVPNPDGTPFFGSPTKLFEYMAMAKPIVASDLDQIGWVLKGWRPGEAAAARGRGRAHARRDPRRAGQRGRRWSRGSAGRSSCPAPSAEALGARRGAWCSSPSPGTATSPPCWSACGREMSRALRRCERLALATVVAGLWCVVTGRTSLAAWRVPVDYSRRRLVHALAAAGRAGTATSRRSAAIEVPELGAPFGASWNDFLRQHKPQYWLAGRLVRAIGLFPAANLLVLLAAVLAALSFFAVARYFRARPEWAFAGACAFALSPFFFYRSLTHLTLAFDWPIPLAILVVSWAFGRRGLPPGSRRFGLALLIVLVAGLHNVYFAALFAQFLGLACLAQWLVRRARTAGARRSARSPCCCP